MAVKGILYVNEIDCKHVRTDASSKCMYQERIKRITEVEITELAVRHYKHMFHIYMLSQIKSVNSVVKHLYPTYHRF
jgi:hypothetical protein